MENLETQQTLPQSAIYRRKVLHWNNNGTKFFTQDEVRVDVVAQTEKSFQIRFKNNRLSWVGRNKVVFVYLNNDNYCSNKQRYIPNSGCKICYNRACYLSGKEFPRSY